MQDMNLFGKRCLMGYRNSSKAAVSLSDQWDDMNEDKFIKIAATEFFIDKLDKAHQYDGSKGPAHPNIIILNGEQIGCMAVEWPTDCVPGFVQWPIYTSINPDRG